MGSGSEWIKVVVQPLGLTGYALFLLFGFLTRTKRRKERRWILGITLIAASITLMGGMALAWRDLRQPDHSISVSPVSTPASQQRLQKQNDRPQSTTGSNSPNVQGVQGDVNFSYGGESQKQGLKQTKKSGVKKTGESHAQ
jgi:hypothetical protein